MSVTNDRPVKPAKKKPTGVKQGRGAANGAAHDALRQVRADAAEYLEQARDEVRGLVCNFEQYVRDQPVKSVLIGAGIGLLYGRFWMRR